ncbi:ATP-binding cassette domain-containing protein [Sinomonas sp. ASV322]|uniref:ATP-binding cassette domain-containing protein n=1 Tax=Sinomonas sp. ASV322 TaxID=3041920 RepID=UPI0027DB74AB|nr:ATP-binding cassette domain-containing protein [Sinomonas sp. ASV322]MDQ4504398.1 ATP-binding cassette domain-containing protein [Sinomonas sp. ASV322]
MSTPLLELRELTKAFGAKVANDRISLTVQPGRVHALVGENGAGKTTLMTMIAGTARPDEGTILVDGVPTEIVSPQKASSLGIGMVHQHFKLVPSLTVAANVFLGHEHHTRSGQLDTARMEAEVAALSERYGLEIDPKARISTLSVGLRQRVEVLKALSHDTRLLILDEPTAVLTPSESDDLFEVVRSLADKGCAVLFISHKLGEVLSIADEVTVIRDGRTIVTVPAAGLSEADIARMMVGREVLLRVKHSPADPQHEVLAVRGLSVMDSRGVTAVNDIDLSVRAGEIVGIAGVEGNGQSELAAAIAGMKEADGGRVLLNGDNVTTASVARRRALGLGYVPEDRHDEGTAPQLSVAENIAATHLAPPVARAGWISGAAMRDLADRLIAKFDVRGATPATPVGSLSGGNMQKVVIARELESEPKLLMVSQPTRGVDVGAMEFVHNSLVAARDKGAAVLVFSADLNEVMSLSDRLLVMYRGRVVAEFTQETMSETAVGLAMAGITPNSDAVELAEAAHQEVAAHVGAHISAGGMTADDVDAAAVAEAAASAVVATQTAAAPAKQNVAEPAAPGRASQRPARGPAEWLGDVAKNVFTSSLQPIVAIALSLLVGVVIILALGDDPLDAYNQLFFSNYTSPEGIGGVVAQFIPLLVLSSAVIVSFRAGLFNIGGEGQLYIGAFAGAWAGFSFPGLPGPLHALLVLACSFAGGLVWGLIPGVLLALWRVDIIVTTLMMSSIAVLLTGYFVTGPFKDPAAGLAGSPKIAADSLLPMFSQDYGLGLDLVLALIAAVVLGLVLTRSVWGLKVRELGQLNHFAAYSGVNTKRLSMEVMALSGAVSGLAGGILVLGPNLGRFLQSFSPGYGFLGITVALLARLNPWAAIISSLFYATMMAGSNSMQINTNVPFPLVSVLQGLIILAITATFVVNRRRKRRRPADATPAGAPAAATTEAAYAAASEGAK